MRETVDKRNAVVASDRLYRAVRNVIQEAHGVVSRVANWAMVEANWRVGFLIVEDEQNGKRKAEYGKAVLAAYGLAPDTPEPEIVAHLFGYMRK